MTTIRACITAILFAAGFLLAAPPEGSASTLDTVRAKGTLVVGVKNDYPPFGFINEAGDTVGFDIDVAKYIAKDLGVKLELRPVTSANRIPMLTNGTVDAVIASMTITREREAVVDFSAPYVVLGGKFLVRKGSGIRGYSDFAGKTVAFTQGTPWGKKLTENAPGAKHLVFQDKPQAVLALLQGKADAYVDDAAPLVTFAQQHGDKLEVVGEASPQLPMGIALRPDDSHWRDAVNFALGDMWDDGTWQETYKKYFGGGLPQNFIIYDSKF